MAPKKKYQLHPVHPKDLVCGTCPARSPWMSSEATTVDRARFQGWRVFDGPSMTGKDLKVVCCPACFKAGTAARPTGTPVLEDQLELPGLITPVPVPKKRSGKRQMS
jgi:hypothetical protein